MDHEMNGIQWITVNVRASEKLRHAQRRLDRDTNVSKSHCNEQTDDDAWASFLHQERLERRRETVQ